MKPCDTCDKKGKCFNPFKCKVYMNYIESDDEPIFGGKYKIDRQDVYIAEFLRK